jgi:hypothetical protein
MTQAEVLGDYLLLWTGPAGYEPGDFSLSRLYLIAWKQGSVTLVSIHYLSHIGSGNGDDGDDSSENVLRGSMELSMWYPRTSLRSYNSTRLELSYADY